MCSSLCFHLRGIIAVQQIWVQTSGASSGILSSVLVINFYWLDLISKMDSCIISLQLILVNNLCVFHIDISLVFLQVDSIFFNPSFFQDVIQIKYWHLSFSSELLNQNLYFSKSSPEAVLTIRDAQYSNLSVLTQLSCCSKDGLRKASHRVSNLNNLSVPAE